MGFRILLIIHYLIQEILVERVLDVYARGVKIKVSRSRCCNDVSSTKKKVHEKIHVLICTRRTICSSRYHGRKDD